MLSPRLVNTISAHSWSPDETTLALCPNSSEIIVYRDFGNGSLTKQCRLREHSQLVSDIHWSREGSFASCSHDGSAYVWTRSGDAWKPELVRLSLFAKYCLSSSLLLVPAHTARTESLHLSIYIHDRAHCPCRCSLGCVLPRCA